MTREEAKSLQLLTGWQEKMYETELGVTHQIINEHNCIIDKIYDEFEKSLRQAYIDGSNDCFNSTKERNFLI